MENTVPFLSVVVPAYNVENYIRECVDSILRQSFADFEVILVDDGATDTTGQICEEYAGRDERVRVIHKKNGGLVSARKAGVRVARGIYTAYVDGDDWIAPDMFRELCECAQREKTDIVIADFFCAFSDRKVPLTQNMAAGRYSREEMQQAVYPHMLCNGEYFSFGFQPCVWGKLFKRELLLKNQLAVDERIKLGEDAACFYPCLLDADSIFYLKEHYLCYYRMRETSISHSMIKSYYTEEILLLLGQLKDKFEEYKELQIELMGQLYMYGCYMLDNMFSPNITFKNLFLNKNMAKQFHLIQNSNVGREIIAYCKNIRTSSRMKRILRVIEKQSIVSKIELYLFVKYERAKR